MTDLTLQHRRGRKTLLRKHCEQRGSSRKQKCGGERPVEELRHGAEPALVGFRGLERIEHLVDLTELLRVACAKVATARHIGDRRQRGLVQVRRRIDLPQAE
jgi:hypothetical protein